MTIDLISDMITRLRNAAIINKKLISLPFNKNNYIIIKILEREGYIFCSTFINNKDKLFLKLLELIFIKKNFSYNDTRVKNLLFFIRNFVKIHQHPENIKKYSKSEKKTLSFLNTIDNNVIKGENFSDPMSSLISKFKNSSIEHKKVKSNSSGSRQFSFKEKTLKNQALSTANLKIDTSSVNNLQIGKDLLNNMDVNFSLKHLLTSIIELKKNLNDLYSNFNLIYINMKSKKVSSDLDDVFSISEDIAEAFDQISGDLTKLQQVFSNSLSVVRKLVLKLDKDTLEENKSEENIISSLTNFQQSLNEIYSLMPMSTNFEKISKNININDLELSLTKLNKHKDDINYYLVDLSLHTDQLQFFLKYGCKQLAAFNLDLPDDPYYPTELRVMANKQQKNLENIKDNLRHELNKNLEDIIFYFTKLAKMLHTITSTFNLTELKKYLDINSSFSIEKRLLMRSWANQNEKIKKKELQQNSFSNQYTSDDIDIKSYIPHLPSIKLELKNNLDYVTSKFSELKQNFNDAKSRQAPLQSSPNSSPILDAAVPVFPETEKNQQIGKEEVKREENRLKEILDNVDSILTPLPSDLFEFSDNAQIDNINSYISRLSAAIIELNNIQLNFNDFSHFSSSFAPYSANKTREFVNGEILTNTNENVNFIDSNLIDKPLKMNERLRKLKKRLKPEEKITDPIQGNNTFLSFAFNKNGDSINSSISPLEKKEYKKPLNLQKYLRKKNNKTFQTLFNPNYSKIILLALNFNTKEKSSIHGIRRISKPSLRCYSSNPIPRSFGGLGVFIVSTNCGIMTDTEAREKKLGGEIMLEVW